MHVSGKPAARAGGTIEYRSSGAVQFDDALPTLSQVTLSPSMDLPRAVSLANTVAAPESLPSGSLSVTAATRLTVLPRVEVVGDETRLVHDNRLRFEPERKLGEGGLGEVIGVLDQDIGRRVAVKRLRSEVKSPVALARFAEEIRITGKLEHPNIIPIHDVGLDEHGDHYFVMKYVDGETLESIIEKLASGDPAYHARYPFERRIEIFQSLLEAVAFAHSRGVIHRDIKPANVMVGQYGEVLLMDWGIAKNKGSAERPGPLSQALPFSPAVNDGTTEGRPFETQVGTLLGTPAYMSPEQSQGLAADERSDVYSLAVLLHEFLGLKHYLAEVRTLQEMLRAVAETEVPALRFVVSPHQPPVPADLNWFVRAGVEKDPGKRYPSVNAMIERLRLRSVGKIPVQCVVTLVKRATNEWSRFVDRHPYLVVSLVAATLLVFLGAVVFAGLLGSGVLRA